MAKDANERIEALLDDTLPDAAAEGETREETLLRLLQEAKEEVGSSPTMAEFNKLDKEVSGDVIKNYFGSWNAAKEAAGLATQQRGTTVAIDEDYFATIDTEKKAYWLGALLVRSSLSEAPIGDGYALTIVRTVDQRHFVDSFCEAVGSEYSINRYEGDQNEKPRLMLQISNPMFIYHLIDAGYPGPDDSTAPFPAIASGLRSAFLRGYLESGGYFSTGGWAIRLESMERAETIQEWLHDFGVKRATISGDSRDDDIHVVRVSNVFDIRAVVDECWPELYETTPCHEPYLDRLIDHLDAEYPYPENVEYLSS